MSKYTNTLQNLVLEFHEKFNHPVATNPTPMELERAIDRKGWGSIEEAIEFIHSSSTNEEEYRESFRELLVRSKTAFTKGLDKPYPKNDTEKLVAQSDAIADELYFLLGDLIEMGIDIEPILNIVHQANLTKLFKNEETGELYAKYNEQGKVVKSPNFQPPEELIKEEVLRQIEQPDLEVEVKPVKKPRAKKVKPIEEVVEVDSEVTE